MTAIGQGLAPRPSFQIDVAAGLQCAAERRAEARRLHACENAV